MWMFSDFLQKSFSSAFNELRLVAACPSIECFYQFFCNKSCHHCLALTYGDWCLAITVLSGKDNARNHQGVHIATSNIYLYLRWQRQMPIGSILSLIPIENANERKEDSFSQSKRCGQNVPPRVKCNHAEITLFESNLQANYLSWDRHWIELARRTFYSKLKWVNIWACRHSIFYAVYCNMLIWLLWLAGGRSRTDCTESITRNMNW